MKSILIAVALFAATAQAVTIHSLRHDAASDEFVFDLTYGGCHLDSFKIEYGLCGETFPMKLHATFDDSKDNCRALIRKELRLSVETHCRPSRMSLETKRSGQRVSLYVPAAE